ncbi:hypothetical protein [Dyella flagellata]|uniref:Uncharacterized protein n=1 Tax=Dyella flagellata TaxID=1867833 RepID=A0ABQ5XAL1_9GAMM|nr:hypothetical protein [Dyella flagellata]GLQ87694.1 hypothetical protein GCM10007898_12610 [Dyella flagellata]
MSSPNHHLASPEQVAKHRRDTILELARTEAWPSTHSFKGDDPAKKRSTGQLLGIWDDKEHCFYYPPFQFLEDGSLNPKLPALLLALSEIPSYRPAEDAGGWGRFDWLDGLRGSMSLRDLAEELSETGIAEHEDLLSLEARRPAEVFLTQPDAVIGLALRDAAAIRDRR